MSSATSGVVLTVALHAPWTFKVALCKVSLEFVRVCWEMKLVISLKINHNSPWDLLPFSVPNLGETFRVARYHEISRRTKRIWDAYLVSVESQAADCTSFFPWSWKELSMAPNWQTPEIQKSSRHSSSFNPIMDPDSSLSWRSKALFLMASFKRWPRTPPWAFKRRDHVGIFYRLHLGHWRIFASDLLRQTIHLADVLL